MYAITMAASQLKIALPEQFAQLVEAFRQLEDKTTKDLKAAPSDGIFGAQGRAVLAEQMRDRLEHCLEQRAAYQQRK